MTQNSHISKPSTASATSTEKTSAGRKKKAASGKERSGSLLLKILTVNLIAPLVLVLGLLYMGQYRDGLIKAELETLQVQAQLFAGAIAESTIKPVEKGPPFLYARPEEIETLVPELARRMVRRLGETTDSRTRLFSYDGTLIGDSHQLMGPGGIVNVTPLSAPQQRVNLSAILAYMGTHLLELMPMRNTLPAFPYTSSNLAHNYPDAALSLRGQISATAWETQNGSIILTAAAPVQKVKQVAGVIMLTKEGHDIKRAMDRVRFDVLTVFLGALSLTIFLSLYLTSMIARPLRKLAIAAESIRQEQSRNIDIPDLTHRHDEIGELSQALRDMTQALWDRMDSIEGFAADVAHEIKNPLTSLRSAVETVAKVKNNNDRDRLMAIILHDVERLDRLISDISNASRLDAELSRDEIGDVDLRTLLEQLADMHQEPMERGDNHENSNTGPVANIILEIPHRRDVHVRGNEGRLAQVFENLISNALSFAPENTAVIVRVELDRKKIRIAVEDEGKGIPDNKLKAIFERFYSERPQHEDYGKHSGLGLSITKQIVEAHGGQIFAENLKDKADNINGACFTVILDKA